MVCVLPTWSPTWNAIPPSFFHFLSIMNFYSSFKAQLGLTCSREPSLTPLFDQFLLLGPHPSPSHSAIYSCPWLNTFQFECYLLYSSVILKNWSFCPQDYHFSWHRECTQRCLPNEAERLNYFFVAQRKSHGLFSDLWAPVVASHPVGSSDPPSGIHTFSSPFPRCIRAGRQNQ